MKARNNSAILVVLLTLLIPLGLGAPTPALAADEIKIGVPTDLRAYEGDEGIKAMKIALDEIYARGGVMLGGKKHTVKLIEMDTRDSAPGVPVADALLVVEKMILQEKVHALMIGPFRSESTLAAMDLIAKYKVPMLTCVAMTPAYNTKIAENKEKYKYCFRPGLNSKQFVGYLVGVFDYMKKEFGFDRVFIMNQDVLWARATGDTIADVLPKSGWKVVGKEVFPTGASDFSAALMKAQATGAQVIMPAFDMPQSGLLAKQMNAMRISALAAGFINPLSGSDAWNAFEGKIEGYIQTIFEVGQIPVPKIPASVTFYNKYKQKWGKEIQAGHTPAAAYDGLHALIEAMERANSLDPDAIVAELEKTDRNGAMGRQRFDETHQAIFGNDPSESVLACLFQWRSEGKRVVVYPESVAEDKIRLPDWLKPAK